MPRLFSVLEYSSWSTQHERDDEQQPLYKIELQDTVRAICGALFFAVPLHFTMEMWERARVMSTTNILIVLLFAYLANVGYNIFSGYKKEKSRKAAWFDALSALGIGAVASTVTMLLIDQISPEISSLIVIKLIALETVPTSFGASLARNQLGGGDPIDKPHVEDQFTVDGRKFMGATLGALLFAFNIAPTMEPIIISASIGHYQVIFIMIFSIVLSYAMIFMGSFVQPDSNQGRIMGNKWAETIIAYAISLIMSGLLLWTFGYLSMETPLVTSLTRVVVLGYVTSLGSSGGRLIL